MADLGNLTVLYAEDVRVEMSGQMTIVGLLNNSVGIDGFPAEITRLAVFLECRFPYEDAPSRLGVDVFLDGELLLGQPEEDLPEPPPRPAMDDDADGRFIMLRASFRLPNFTIEKAAKLTLSVRTDLGEIQAVPLRFVPADNSGPAVAVQERKTTKGSRAG